MTSAVLQQIHVCMQNAESICNRSLKLKLNLHSASCPYHFCCSWNKHLHICRVILVVMNSIINSINKKMKLVLIPIPEPFHIVLCSQNLISAILVKLDTAQKMKFSIKDFSSKCDQIRSFLRICSHLLKKSSMENFNFVQCENHNR